MKRYQTWNNLLGWLVCAIACTVFISTAERTTSWWDCGEYISTAAKLMVGHPPGAPTFQILGCIANIFTFGDATQTAFAVNILSALCSGFTILFLFWTITMLGKKLCWAVARRKESAADLQTSSMPADFRPTLLQSLMIFAAGIIGALAYTFTDSFWFSAVEGEVYAMSSFFTAITFWAILKWESHADEPHHLRWIIFIAFLIGLAIGVHLLNLLVIPACVFIVYYKKFQPSRKGFWYSMLLSVVLLAGILWGIVPWTVKLAGYFELFFVNVLRLPFHSGTVFYFLALAGGLVGGLLYAYRRNKVVLHTALLCLSFLLIGYSTFLTLVIRSNANVPLNENEPKDALSLLAYLNREQYGSRPLFYGQYYNARIIDIKEVSPKYVRNPETKRYDKVGTNVQYVYDPAHCGLFPRMYSNSDSGGRNHIKYYKFWSGTTADNGTPKPTMGENLRFYFRYHLNWMYFRYFMWNFAGRQNNLQGLGYNEDGSRDLLHGNWISGIGFLDKMRLGPQANLPDYLANNHARNKFYLLPLLLGLAGLIFQYRAHRRDCFVVFLLFFMTGLAIVTYLNEPSTEPRERDYAYAGSFYAYAIWIGLGVVALSEWLMKLLKKPHVAVPVAVGALCLIAVPGIMAKEGWDDHDRSHRTAAYDFAKNALLSCEDESVIIANGDNDTFPVWYCQEVEGVKNSVRIVNSALANSFWHIQPLFRQVYASKPLNFTLPFDQYGQGVNDYAYLQNGQENKSVELASCLRYMGNPRSQVMTRDGEKISVFPTRNVKVTVPIEKMLASGFLTEDQAARCLPEISWQIQKTDALYRVDIALLDLMASNFASRPLYFMSAGAQANVLPLPHLAQLEGNVYRMVPYMNENRRVIGDNGVNTDKTYDLYVNRFRWGNLNDPKTAIDPESAAYSRAVRYQYIMLAKALMFEGKRDSAVAALDKSLYFFPHAQVPFDGLMLYQVEAYLQAGAFEQATALAQQLCRIYGHRLQYAESFPPRFQNSLMEEIRECLSVMAEMEHILSPFVGREPALQGSIDICKNTLQAYGY